MFFTAKRYSDAEESYSSALKLLTRLAKRTPEAFEPELAKCYFSMSELYTEIERFTEAKEALSSAITLYDKYADINPACAEKATDSRKALDSLKEVQRFANGKNSGLSPEEKKIAALLADGLTKREIIRKLHISASVFEKYEKSFREKLDLTAVIDKVTAAAATKYMLTKRETEVLGCLRQNMSNDEIAAELLLSDDTVRKYVRNLMKKIPIEKRSNIAEWD